MTDVRIDRERQAAFALLSGDFNPLHVDEQSARRSQFGGTVVHGVHLVLLALQEVVGAEPVTIASLDAQFRAPVLVGDVAHIEVVRQAGATSVGSRMTVSVAGRVCSTIGVVLETGDVDRVGGAPAWSELPLASYEIGDLDLVSGDEPVGLDAPLLTTLFPGLARVVSTRDLAVLLATTRVIGMRCPGRWALFRRLRWGAGQGVAEARLHYDVTSVQPRFAMLYVAMGDGVRSVETEVIIRRPPPTQIGFEAAREMVESDEMVGERVLIVGGSRGLGEVASKIVVAAGATAMVTYRAGGGDADALVAELGSRTSSLWFDVLEPTTSVQSQIEAWAPTSVLYFASPLIAKRPPATWDTALFGAFCAVYVEGFAMTVAAAARGGSLRTVFFPSSTFLDDRPAGFAEYIASKRLGETLCDELEVLDATLVIGRPRLPPLVTDQTSALLGGDTTGNALVIRDELRRLFAKR